MCCAVLCRCEQNTFWVAAAAAAAARVVSAEVVGCAADTVHSATIRFEVDVGDLANTIHAGRRYRRRRCRCIQSTFVTAAVIVTVPTGVGPEVYLLLPSASVCEV